MPSPKSAASNAAPLHDGSSLPTNRLHVLVTPTDDARALLSSLAALSVARDQRLEVTAICPPSGMSGWTFDRRFRILDPRAANESPDGITVEGLIDHLELDAEDLVIVLRAGCLPPRGWLASVLIQSQETGARGVAALPWHPRPQGNPETELLGWEAEAQGAQLHHAHHSEDRAEVETPLLAIVRPDLIQSALKAFWLSGCATALNLRVADDASARLVVAKDILVWQDEHTPPLCAEVVVEHQDALPRLPRTLEEAKALEARLVELLERNNQPDLHMRLAEIVISRGDRALALTHARACLEVWPEHAAAKLILARAMIVYNRLVPSRQIIENLLSMGPIATADRATAFACLANIWLRQGDPSQARPCLDVALAIDADHAIARYGMARIAQAAGRFSEALEHLEVCLLKMPLSPDVHYELGRARVLAGLIEPGMHALGLALQLNPDHRDAATLMERLGGH